MDDNNNMIATDLFERYVRLTVDDVVQSSRWFSSFGHNDARFQEDLDWSLVYFKKSTDPTLYTRMYGNMLTYDKKSHGEPLLFKLIVNERSTTKGTDQGAIITIFGTYQK